MKKNSILLTFILSFITFFISSCQYKEDPKKSSSFSIEKLKINLPPSWSLKITNIKTPPHKWRGPTADGIKLELYNTNPKNLQSEKKSYKKLYPNSESSQKLKPQLVRYLYRKLEAGYSFGMMQRIHPAILEGVTEQFVIIKPPSVSSEKDYNVPKSIKNLFYKFLNLSLNEPFKKAEIVKEAFNSQFHKKLKENKSKYSDKKAVIFKEERHGTESLGVLTLK